ncbi:MAG: hypothetical protein AAF591_18495 [Verrucomicrobiota bacterium]
MRSKQFIPEGNYFLIIVEDGAITHKTANICLPHKEFVRRKIGNLPKGAWVGSVAKVDGSLEAFNSFTFYGNELPANDSVQTAVQEVFE